MMIVNTCRLGHRLQRGQRRLRAAASGAGWPGSRPAPTGADRWPTGCTCRRPTAVRPSPMPRGRRWPWPRMGRARRGEPAVVAQGRRALPLRVARLGAGLHRARRRTTHAGRQRRGCRRRTRPRGGASGRRATGDRGDTDLHPARGAEHDHLRAGGEPEPVSRPAPAGPCRRARDEPGRGLVPARGVRVRRTRRAAPRHRPGGVATTRHGTGPGLAGARPRRAAGVPRRGTAGVGRTARPCCSTTSPGTVRRT